MKLFPFRFFFVAPYQYYRPCCANVRVLALSVCMCVCFKKKKNEISNGHKFYNRFLCAVRVHTFYSAIGSAGHDQQDARACTAPMVERCRDVAACLIRTKINNNNKLNNKIEEV